MKRVRMNWMLKWLVTAVIIVSCLACHLGYAYPSSWKVDDGS